MGPTKTYDMPMEKRDGQSPVVLDDVVVIPPQDDIEDTHGQTSGCARWVEKIEKQIGDVIAARWKFICYGIKFMLVLAYLAYFGYCMHYRFGDEGSYTLIGVTAFFGLIIVKRLKHLTGTKCALPPGMNLCMHSRTWKRLRIFMRYGLYLAVVIALATYIGIAILKDRPGNTRSLLGILVLLLVCFIFSSKPSAVNWHSVFWGCAIQFVFATLTLRTQVGSDIFLWLGNLIETLIGFADAGARFVIGREYSTMGLAFRNAGVLIFINSLINVLIYWGVIEFVVKNLGSALSFCLETGPVESIIAAANIFLGLAEAPLLIRPYIATVTKSEIHTIMTCGFASIAGGLMGVYIQFGASAQHLLTAAVISAPSALAVSKLICPETETVDLSKQSHITMTDKDRRPQSTLAACSEGAVMVVKLIVAIMANMLAFVSVLAMINAILSWMGERAGVPDLTFELICSYVLYPLAYVMGTDPEDCGTLGTLLGVKLFATPMIAYSQLGKMVKNRAIFEDYLASGQGTYHWVDRNVILDNTNTTLVYGVMSERSEAIATYAMCGFSAFTAIGISLGTLIQMCPARKDDITSLVMRAFFAGNVASFMTAAVAGLMHTG